MSFIKKIFVWRVWRVLLFVAVALVTLTALAIAFENWRGKRAWLRFKTDAESRGEKLDLASFLPPPVPPADNFAMTPVLAPLFDYTHSDLSVPLGGAEEVRAPHVVWRDSNALARVQSISVTGGDARELPPFGKREKSQRTDLQAWQQYYAASTNLALTQPGTSPGAVILDALSKYDAVFAELHQAARRPHAVFLIHYDESISALLPHLAVLKNLATVLRLRALALLDLNQPARALDDISLILRLAEAIKSEPLLISQLVRIAIIHTAADTLWEGFATGRWDEHQLAKLQSVLSSIDLLADYDRALGGERAFGNDFVQRMRAGEDYGGALEGLARFAPRGLLYQNQLTINRMYQTHFFGVIDLEKRRVDVGRATSGEKAGFRRRHPYEFLAALLLPALEKSSSQFARGQTALDQTTIACALERYRLVHQRFPAKLDDLKPQFMRAIPHDLITGEPLHYSSENGETFFLYSVGWDQDDDHGRAGTKPMEDGDWMWTPAPRSTN